MPHLQISNTLITRDRLDAMIVLAGQTPPGGHFAEVGVYKGGSLKFLAMSFPKANILGFDSFEGLPPEQWNENEVHKPGEFSDTNLEFVRDFLSEHNDHVTLVKGLFPASAGLASNFLFSFVHVDTDFYMSVKSCIEWFWPRMLPGGIMVFDDYLWPNCPGVERALVEFGKPVHKSVAEYQAYLIKEK